MEPRIVTMQARTVLVAIAMALAASMATLFAYEGKGEVRGLITDADAIVAVEILTTDYKATEADGPMYADAKVLKMIKGGLAPGRMLRFGESGWWSPTYRVGERRILFLNRVTSQDYFSAAPWASLHSGGIDFFFATDSIETLSSASLEAFLKRVQEARRTPLQIEVTPKDKSRLVLSVKLINKSDQPIWLHPSRVVASFEANNIHYSRNVEFSDEGRGAWITIPAEGAVAGTVSIAGKEVRGAKTIVLWISHRSVYFPERCWTGTVSTSVQLVR